MTEELIHICEVCGVEKVMTPDQAFDEGWDYPPRMGVYGIVSPRTCGNCPVNETLWWRLAVEHKTDLTPEEEALVERIENEPGSITPKEATHD